MGHDLPPLHSHDDLSLGVVTFLSDGVGNGGGWPHAGSRIRAVGGKGRPGALTKCIPEETAGEP
jgi:hypothetical protein